MEIETFTKTLKSLRWRTPFRPFTVSLENGNRFEVDFPDALSIREGVAVYIDSGSVPVIFDHSTVSQIRADLMQQPS